MPDYTSFLNLTLPELNEFLNSWNEPVNQNMEDLDDWLKDLHDNLVATGTGSVWSSLRGSMDSLAERLNVSIRTDGTIDVSSSADVLNMAISEVRGEGFEPSGVSSPRARLDENDFEVYGARQPFGGDRFAPFPVSGPSAGFPPEGIDSGVAIRTADYGVTPNEPISSPVRPWTAGLMMSTNPFVTGVDESQIRLNAASAPAIFNIDGYTFRLREDILFDYAATSPVTDEYQWFYAERVEAGYNNANFKYSEIGGTPVAKDLRKLKSGSSGSTGGSPVLNEFQVAAGLFTTAPFVPQEGDILVVEGSSAASGSYVILSITDGNNLVIKGQFYGSGSGLTWHILDNSMPNIGVAVAVANADEPTSRPPVVAGRVYFARAKQVSAAPPFPLVNFIKGGVYDSGWLDKDSGDFPITAHEHLLGAIPSSVELWVRVDETEPAYRPTVRRQLVTKMSSANFPDPVAGDTSFNTNFRLPSMYYRCSDTEINIYLASESTDPSLPAALFTDSSGAEQTSGQIRIIARR